VRQRWRAVVSCYCCGARAGRRRERRGAVMAEERERRVEGFYPKLFLLY